MPILGVDDQPSFGSSGGDLGVDIPHNRLCIGHVEVALGIDKVVLHVDDDQSGFGVGHGANLVRLQTGSIWLKFRISYLKRIARPRALTEPDERLSKR